MGLRHVNYDLALEFDDPVDRWFSEQVLVFGLMLLAARNWMYLRAHPETPHLYDSGLVYKMPEPLVRQPSDAQLADFRKFLSGRMGMTALEAQHHIDLARGVEIFRDIPRMMENGGGDCDNMASFRAAELCVAGVNARPYMTCRPRPDGKGSIYHALVKHPDGSSEDPSLILGMGGAAKRAERWEECRKNLERYDNLWQEGKQLMASEQFSSEADRLARATQIKRVIDACGYLPSDGVFRVGPKTQSLAPRSPRNLLRGAA